MTIDSVSVDIIGSRLVAIAEEMGVMMIRAAHSPNIRERHDCTAALLDVDGNIVAQAEHIPIHLGSILGFVPQIRRQYPQGLQRGDVLISNEPHQGGSTHLPDITLVTPLFDDDDTCVGYAAAVAHHAEVGGSLGSSTDVVGEGINIPIVHLSRAGTVQQDVVNMILTNCRVPSERRGDLDAQLAAVLLGARRFDGLVERYGADVLAEATIEWLRKAEQQARAALRRLPHGTFSFTDYMDSSHLAGAERPAITATVTIGPDTIDVDFTGTSPQVHGQINTTISALQASVYYALKTVLDPTLPANSGYFRIINVTAPERTLVNSRRPAAVLHRSDTCQRVVDTILGALATAIPHQIPAASNGSITGVVLSGEDPATGNQFAYVEVIAGGAGAMADRDGQSAVQCHITNTANTPIEAVEIAYPLVIDRYSIRPDSGGAGKHHGGAGIVRSIRTTAPGIRVSVKGDRADAGPWGLRGGEPGGVLQFWLQQTTNSDRVPLHISDNGVALPTGGVVTIASAGGGGYGAATNRSDQQHS